MHLHMHRSLLVLLVAVAMLAVAGPTMAQWSHSEVYIGPGGSSYEHRSSGFNSSWGLRLNTGPGVVDFDYYSRNDNNYMGYQSSPWGSRMELGNFGRCSSNLTVDFGGHGYGGYQPSTYYRPRPKIYLNW